MAMITPEAKALLTSVLENGIEAVKQARADAIGRSTNHEGSDRYNDLKDAASFKLFLTQLHSMQEMWLQKEGKPFMTEILHITKAAQEALAAFDDSIDSAGQAASEAKELLE